jgi:hypothetical protein
MNKPQGLQLHCKPFLLFHSDSTLRAWHLYSPNSPWVPTWFYRPLTCSPHHPSSICPKKKNKTKHPATPTYILTENCPWLSRPTGSSISSKSWRVKSLTKPLGGSQWLKAKRCLQSSQPLANGS